MPSTAISRIAYEARTRTLSVWFRPSGELYRYYDVPANVHEAFRHAESMGRFFNRHIRNRYRFRHIRGPDGGQHAA